MEDVRETPEGPFEGDPFDGDAERYSASISRLNEVQQRSWAWDYETAVDGLLSILDLYEEEELKVSYNALERLKDKRKNVDVEPVLTDQGGEQEQIKLSDDDARLFRKLARSRKTSFETLAERREYLVGEIARQADRRARKLLYIVGVDDLPKKGKALATLRSLRDRLRGSDNEDDTSTGEEGRRRIVIPGLHRIASFSYRTRQVDVQTFEVRAVLDTALDLTVDTIRSKLDQLDVRVSPLGRSGDVNADSDIPIYSAEGSVGVRIVGDDALFDLSIIEGRYALGEVRPFEPTDDLDIVDQVFDAIG
jgi:hypothetical protein